MARAGVILGGRPTEPDVKRLLDTYQEIAVGQLLTYDEVGVVIGERPGTSRFRTVTDAWRARLLREFNFRLEPVKGQGFQRISEVERSSRDARGWVQSQRRAGRHVRDMERVDTSKLADRELDKHTHIRRVLVAHLEHTRTVSREIAPPKAQLSLPRAKP